MNTDTIKITSDIQIYQEQKTTDDIIFWSLILSNSKTGNIELKKSEIFTKPENLIGNNYFLNIPNLISAFMEDKDLFVILYEKLEINLYRFRFTQEKEYETKKYLLGEVMRGSVDNFGGYDIHVHKNKIEQNYYVDLKFKRSVGAATELILFYNVKSGKVNSLIFTDNYRTIKDEKKTFYSMDLDNDKELIGIKIQELLVIHNIYSGSKIEYLGYLDDFSSYHSKRNTSYRNVGMIYFFYKKSVNISEINIIRYNNYNSEWLIGDYEEIKIKSKK